MSDSEMTWDVDITVFDVWLALHNVLRGAVSVYRTGSVYWSGGDAVWGAVEGAVNRAVGGAVNGTVGGATSRAVYGNMSDPAHPALQDFLHYARRT